MEQMKISVYGAGYVGLVTAACLAELGHQVLCVDVDKQKIAQCSAAESPIHEEGLPNLLSKGIASKRLSFSTDLVLAARFSPIQMIAVGTPAASNGAADMTAFWAVVEHIATHVTQETVIVTKSTVPVGTGAILQQWLDDRQSKASKKNSLHAASNPEFLRQGTAVNDFLFADRIVLGVQNEFARTALQALYKPLITRGVPCMTLSVSSAELIKYAANAFLATKISFMNELSGLAESVGADITEVKRGMAFDARINEQFLNAGCGYGGSCFPKDVQAIAHVAEQHGLSADIMRAAHRVNERQKQVVPQKIREHFAAGLSGKKVAVWGLAFKPGTDDLRDAPSDKVMEFLWQEGADVCVYDPVAEKKAKQLYSQQTALTFVADPLMCVRGAEALVILTEWPEFADCSPKQLAEISEGLTIFDGRNMYQPDEMSQYGINYYSIGRPAVLATCVAEAV